MLSPMKLAYTDFEVALFAFLETESWPDTLFCIFSYAFIIMLFCVAFLFPLVFFAYLFLLSLL